ncbi:MAG: 30S ribosomal protein S16 [Bacteroidales bacterium]
MAVRIRLARAGKKNYAFYHIVVADSRAPRDGRFIEQIGYYNPNTNPATIKLDNEKALKWLDVGAQPSETCRRILSYKGVLLMKHLQGGVAKGAFTQEEAEKKWGEWNREKEQKIANRKEQLSQESDKKRKLSLEAEAKVNTTRAEALNKKRMEEEAAAAKAAAKAKGEGDDQEAQVEASTQESGSPESKSENQE